MKISYVFEAAKLMVLAMLLGLTPQGCGSDDSGGGGGGGGPGPGIGVFPEIEISPAEICEKSGLALKNCTYEVDQGQVFPGDSLDTIIRIKNTGERNMLIKSVTLDYTPPAEMDGEDPLAFSIQFPDSYNDAVAAGEEFYVASTGQGTDEIPEELAVKVTFYRHNDELTRSATLNISTDASNSPNVPVKITTQEGQPKIQVSPDWVVFQQVGMGESKEEKVNVLNTGASDLKITGFKFVSVTGGEFYTLMIQGTEYPIAEVPDTGITFDEGSEIIVAPQNATYFKVRFEPQDDKAATAKLIIFSNDGSSPETEVMVSGNESVPCIAVNPEKVNFGGKVFGEQAIAPLEISACGEAPLEIYSIYVKEGSSPDFDWDASGLEAVPTPEEPLVVPIGATVNISVIFIPDAPNPLDGNGNLILDEGAIMIINNSFEQEKEVLLSGAGVLIECPTAIIKCAEGDEVIPQSVLHLYGDESYAANGTIQKWEWDVDQPAGSQSVFVPSYNFPNPTFETNVAGVYTFYLTVYDQTNTPSCFPASYEVVVIPDEAIHIELLWHTPEDPDETDTGPEAGSDLDLHFLHPWAAGPDLDGDGAPDGWFDIPFDGFWFNAHPNWGSYDPAINDDPGLDRDDTDGAGPENINLDIPENVTYRVGVHYWNDHGYGASYATVRVYIYAQLVFEVADVMLVDSDMWEVCTVEWPSGKVQVVTDPVGQYFITPQYQNPYFFQ